MFSVEIKERKEEQVEMVERKGKGHPDSLADGISEAVSRELCKRYREKLGFVAHHNTDEVQIIGGQSRPAYSGGKMSRPIYILLGGRATMEYDGKSFNVHGAAIKAAKEYLDETVEHLNVEEDVVVDSRIGEGSPDLTELYSRDEETPVANDTSFGVGHYPLTDTERTVKEIENFLNSSRGKKALPWIGEDVKVMAVRRGDSLDITVAAAFLGSEVEDIDDYSDKKEVTLQRIREKVSETTEKDFEVRINTADDVDKGSVYLTVTGTSAEMGDDGSTGRGNRTNGLITPYQPMSLEATSGKNPVAHVGKIYNVLSKFIARKVVENIEEADSATVRILSRIGEPVDKPQQLDIEIESVSEGEKLKSSSIKIAEKWLGRIPEVMEKVIEQDIETF